MATQYDNFFKILLLGDSGVGKSCILTQFADETFSTEFMTTIGIDYKIKTLKINGKLVKMQIWDTAGQERFQTITTSYYRGATGIMLVYDITKEETFENIAKWIGNIKKHASESVVTMLVGNKCDTSEDRAISKQRGQQLANDYGVLFEEASAKTNENVGKIFNDITVEILKNMPSQPQTNTIRLSRQNARQKKRC